MTIKRFARAGLAALGAVIVTCAVGAQPAAAAGSGWTISRYAGNGAAAAPAAGTATSSQLRQTWEIAFDRPANLYIAASANNRVEKVTPGGRLSLFAGTGGTGAP